MGDWTVLVVTLLIGGTILVVGAAVDLRRRRRSEGAGLAPDRGTETVDAHVPAYITQAEVDAMPLPAKSGRGPGTATPGGLCLGFGHLGPEFATAGTRAVFPDPRIIMVDGEITSIRELLSPLASATPDSPVVLVALAFADDVLSTLRANRRALGTAVLAATPSRRDLYELAALVGGEVLSEQDLRSGYVPESSLGRASRWTSDERRTWVEAPPKA